MTLSKISDFKLILGQTRRVFVRDQNFWSERGNAMAKHQCNLGAECVECRLSSPLRVVLSPTRIAYLKTTHVAENQVRLLKAEQVIARSARPLTAPDTDLTGRSDLRDLFVHDDCVELRLPTVAPTLIGLIPLKDRGNLLALGIVDEIRRAFEGVFVSRNTLTPVQKETCRATLARCTPNAIGSLYSVLDEKVATAASLPSRTAEETEVFWRQFNPDEARPAATVIPLRSEQS